MTYGRTLRKQLKKFSIDPDSWHELAADRNVWRETLRLGHPAIRRSQRIAKRPRAQLPTALSADATAAAYPCTTAWPRPQPDSACHGPPSPRLRTEDHTLQYLLSAAPPHSTLMLCDSHNPVCMYLVCM